MKTYLERQTENFYGPDRTQEDWRGRKSRVIMETAIEVRLAFHLARCLAETPWSSVTPEHLASTCSKSSLNKVKAVELSISMMSAMAEAAEGLPDVQLLVEQVSPGGRKGEGGHTCHDCLEIKPTG